MAEDGITAVVWFKRGKPSGVGALAEDVILESTPRSSARR